MWTKTIDVDFLKRKEQVQVWLSDTGDDGQTEIVTIQSMINEFYLLEKIIFENRDAAYDFIKLFNTSLAKSFLNRAAYAEGAVQ